MNASEVSGTAKTSKTGEAATCDKILYQCLKTCSSVQIGLVFWKNSERLPHV